MDSSFATVTSVELKVEKYARKIEEILDQATETGDLDDDQCTHLRRALSWLSLAQLELEQV